MTISCRNMRRCARGSMAQKTDQKAAETSWMPDPSRSFFLTRFCVRPQLFYPPNYLQSFCPDLLSFLFCSKLSRVAAISMIGFLFFCHPLIYRMAQNDAFKNLNTRIISKCSLFPGQESFSGNHSLVTSKLCPFPFHHFSQGMNQAHKELFSPRKK